MKEINIIILVWISVALFFVGLIVLFILRFIKKDTTIVTIEKSLKEGSYKKALNLALKILKDDPKDFLIKYYIGQAYEGLKDYKQAVFYYEKASVAAALSAQEEIKNQIFLKVAENYKKIKRYNEALGYYALVLDKEPKNLKALFGAGELMFEEGNYRKAREYLESYIKLKPDNLRVRFMLGVSCYHSNEYIRAIEHLEFVVSNYKITDDAFYKNSVFSLSDAYIATKNYSKAIDLLKKLLEKEIENDVVIPKIADTYLKNNQIKETILFCQQNLNKVSKEKQCELYYTMGNAYIKQDEILEAVKAWHSAYKINPNYRDLKSLISRYSYLIQYPEIAPLFSKNEEVFEEFAIKLLRAPYIKQVIKKDNFWAFESGDESYVIYRKPFPVNFAELNEIEKIINLNFKANTKYTLFSLYGITDENNTSNITYNTGKIDLVSDIDFIKRLQKGKD